MRDEARPNPKRSWVGKTEKMLVSAGNSFAASVGNASDDQIAERVARAICAKMGGQRVYVVARTTARDFMAFKDSAILDGVFSEQALSDLGVCNKAAAGAMFELLGIAERLKEKVRK